MALDFPTSPTVGQKYPQPAIGGVPVYTWDGEKWAINVTQGQTPIYADGSVPMTAQLTLISPPVAVTDAAAKGYADAVAADNLVVNGFCDISQEYGAATVNIVAGDTKYVIDQWQCSMGGSAVAAAGGQLATSLLPGINNHLWFGPGAVFNPTTNQFALCQTHIEGHRIAKLSWGNAFGQSLAIGFWVSSLIAGTFTLAVRNGATNRSYCVPITVPASTWVYRTAVIPPCLDGAWEIAGALGLTISFTVASGSFYTAPSANAWVTGNYIAAPTQTNLFGGASQINIAGVTAIPGTVPIPQAQCPSMRRASAEEAKLCQRFFSMRSYFSGSVHTMAKYIGGGCYDRYQFPVQMRSIPTMSITNTTNWMYINASAQWVALGSVVPGSIDDYFGAFTAGAVDLDAVVRMYQQNSGATQYIKASSRF